MILNLKCFRFKRAFFFVMLMHKMYYINCLKCNIPYEPPCPFVHNKSHNFNAPIGAFVHKQVHFYSLFKYTICFCVFSLSVRVCASVSVCVQCCALSEIEYRFYCPTWIDLYFYTSLKTCRNLANFGFSPEVRIQGIKWGGALHFCPPPPR